MAVDTALYGLFAMSFFGISMVSFSPIIFVSMQIRASKRTV